MTDQSSTRAVGTRWSRIFLTAVAGAAITALPFLNDRYQWHWSPTLTGTLTNVGTSILLAGALFVAERQFTKRVARAVQTSARDAAQRAVKSEFQDQHASLNLRIDQLEEQIKKDLQEADAKQDEIVRSIEHDVTFETVTTALEQAADLQAFATDTASVPAQANTLDMRVSISWALHRDPDARQAEPRLTLEYLPAPRPSGPRYIMEVQWRPQQTASDVGTALVREMQKSGYGQDSQTFDWPYTLRSLSRAIQDAIEARRTGSHWFQGDLIEWINEDWAVTSSGLYNRHRSIVVRGEDFPDRPAFGHAPHQPKADSPPIPEPPEGVPASEWSIVYSRARRLLPRNPSIAALSAYSGYNRPQPIDTETGNGLRSSGII